MALEINQFKQGTTKGKVDQALSPSNTSAIIDETEAGELKAGDPVVIVPGVKKGVPAVVKATAVTDDIFGFIAYDLKSQSFKKGDRIEVAFAQGSVIVLEAAKAIDRWVDVILDVTDPANIKVTDTVAGGETIVGRTYDGAKGDEDLIRVWINLPGVAAATPSP